MKRENVRLYRENRWTNDGRMLVDTILTPEVPLVSDVGRIIGMVTGARRAEEGWVLGDLSSLTIDENYLVGLACEAQFVEVTQDRSDLDGRLIARGPRLRAVVVGERPCWKGMKFK